MKTMYYIIEAYPREAAMKSIPLIEKLLKCLDRMNVSLEIIIFSDTKLNSEKIGYMAEVVRTVTGKEVREMNSYDYFETLKTMIEPYNCFGIAALSSPFSDEYIPRFSAALHKMYVGACYGISSENNTIILTKERYGGQVAEDISVPDAGACFTLVSIKEGRPDSTKRISAELLLKSEPVKAELFFIKTDDIPQQYKNRKDIRESRSFIAISDDIKRPDVSEREAEVIAKNMQGVKIGDCSALAAGFIDPEREISLTARPVTSSFMLNFGMRGLPGEVNAVSSRGTVVFVGKRHKNLFSKLSDIVIDRDAESFLIKFCSEIEKYPRY